MRVSAVDVYLNNCIHFTGGEERMFGDRIRTGVRRVRAGSVLGEPAVRRTSQPNRAQVTFQRWNSDHGHLRHIVWV